jgi:hypothetical protein
MSTLHDGMPACFTESPVFFEDFRVRAHRGCSLLKIPAKSAVDRRDCLVYSALLRLSQDSVGANRWRYSHTGAGGPGRSGKRSVKELPELTVGRHSVHTGGTQGRRWSHVLALCRLESPSLPKARQALAARTDAHCARCSGKPRARATRPSRDLAGAASCSLDPLLLTCAPDQERLLLAAHRAPGAAGCSSAVAASCLLDPAAAVEEERLLLAAQLREFALPRRHQFEALGQQGVLFLDGRL